MMQNIVQFWPGVGITLLALIIPTVLACIIQFFLSKNKDVKYGRRFLTFSFVVTTIFVIVVVTNGFMAVKTPIGETSFSDETLDDVIIKIYAMIDDETEEIEAFSDLVITNKITGEVEYVPLQFNNQGILIGSEKALRYSSDIERLSPIVNAFAGKSYKIEEMRKAYVEKYGSERWEVVFLGLMFYLVFIIQLIVHKAVRRVVVKKQCVAEIERMKILEI